MKSEVVRLVSNSRQALREWWHSRGEISSFWKTCQSTISAGIQVHLQDTPTATPSPCCFVPPPGTRKLLSSQQGAHTLWHRSANLVQLLATKAALPRQQSTGRCTNTTWNTEIQTANHHITSTEKNSRSIHLHPKPPNNPPFTNPKQIHSPLLSSTRPITPNEVLKARDNRKANNETATIHNKNKPTVTTQTQTEQ